MSPIKNQKEKKNQELSYTDKLRGNIKFQYFIKWRAMLKLTYTGIALLV